MSDKLKKLTGKNPKDFEQAAYNLINNSDAELFCELVSKEDFLFDFVKQKVISRLMKVCNESNYLNLLNFLKYYSPTYEEFIVSTLAFYADEDLTDRMLDIFETGTDAEKTYCAKFFSYIRDTLAIGLLKKYAWSVNPYLSRNCASTLAVLKDKDSYNDALKMLSCGDEFTRLEGVKFLAAYGDIDAVPNIINTAKTSSMPENIACELLYLTDWSALFEINKQDALFILNSVINGLGEILPLSVVFDFQLYNIFEMLLKESENSKLAAVLCNAGEKFNTLTGNDAYLFDQTNDIRQEVYDIKQLLDCINITKLSGLLDEELTSDSLFVYTALEFTKNKTKARELLSSSNPAIVLKSLEILKQSDEITYSDRQTALKSVDDEKLKNIILAI